MKVVFADSFYWIALLNPADDWHTRAVAECPSDQATTIVTCDEVLVEVLAFFSGFGSSARAMAASFVRSLLSRPDVEVVPQSRSTLFAGLTLYEKRLDKNWSLVDCIAFETMRERRLLEALTGDVHYEQAGFLRRFLP